VSSPGLGTWNRGSRRLNAALGPVGFIEGVVVVVALGMPARDASG